MQATPLNVRDWQEFSGSDPEEAARHWLARLDAVDPEVRRAAVAVAAGGDELAAEWRRSVETGGPLGGVPFLVKDLFDIEGWPTTASSTFLSEVRPTPSSDARFVASVRRRGAVLAGKSHLNEFAYGLSGENPHYGSCPHPQAPTLLSGGSSSGSAWAVGSGLVPFALGTDTGGSVRVPASYCGLFGVRLTPRHPWSREGCFPLAPSFDSAGWFTRGAADMAHLLQLLIGRSSTGTGGAARGLWLGDPTSTIDRRLLDEMARLAKKLGAGMDASAQEGFCQGVKDAAFAFNVLQSTEAMAVHFAWINRFADRYDPAVLARIRRAENWSDEERQRAAVIQDQVGRIFRMLFRQWDFLVLPAVSQPAVGAHDLKSELRETLLALNTPASLAGLPALAVPLFLDAVRSVGLQVVFPRIDGSAMIDVLSRLAG